MKKLLFGVLTAFGVALGANAAEAGAETTRTTETTFETNDETVSVQETQQGTLLLKTGTYWSVDGVEGTDVATTSKVTEYENGEGSNKTELDFGSVGSDGMTNGPGNNYLTIDADSVLLRNNEATLNGSYYIDTMVKFTATDLADAQMEAEIADSEKIVVWMYQEGSTEIPAPVLKVAGGFVDSIDSGISVSKKTYTAVGSYNEGTWYRLSVKAISDPFKGVSGGVSFVVCINGTPLTYVDYAITASAIATSFTPKTEYRAFVNNLIPSRVQGATELAGLGFKGNGAVDNILFSAAAPCNALQDSSKVVYYNVNGTEYVTFAEAVDAALASETPATIFLVKDLDFDSMSEPLSIDWSNVTLAGATTVVLDLNGNTIPVLNNDGISIDIKGSKAKNGTIKIISSTGNAIVQGLVVANSSEVIIGDANDTVDKGVTYADADMFDNTDSTITLHKGNFKNDPTANQVATVDDRYELVNPTSECVYYTIKQKAQPTTTSVTITLGEGIASATYKIGDATEVQIDKTTTVVPDVAIDATIKVTPKAKEGYTANIVEVPVTADMTINVTATRNNYNLTITLGEGVASATYRLGEAEEVTVTPETPENEKTVSVPYKTAVTISATAAEGYTLNPIAEGDASFNMPAEAKTVSITATRNVTEVTPTITLSATEATFSATLALPTVTVEGYTLDTDYTVSWDKNLPTKNPTENVVLTVTVTMKGAYSGSATATFTVKPVVSYPEFVGGDEGVKAKFDAWVEKYGVADRTDSTATFQEAYLLNVNPTDAAAIKNAKEAFKITAIEFVDGKLVPTWPTDDGTFNGRIQKKCSTSIGAEAKWEDWEDVTDANRGKFKFFKAVLTK